MEGNRELSNRTRFSESRFSDGFSIIELVFVIVILGILTAVAIPRISLTRGDANLTAVEIDIQNTISAIQREAFAKDISSADISGDWMMDVAGLKRTRWIPIKSGVRLAKDGIIDEKNDCVKIDFSEGVLIFKIDKVADSPMCEKLFERHKGEITKIVIIGNSGVRF